MQWSLFVGNALTIGSPVDHQITSSAFLDGWLQKQTNNWEKFRYYYNLDDDCVRVCVCVRVSVSMRAEFSMCLNSIYIFLTVS